MSRRHRQAPSPLQQLLVACQFGGSSQEIKMLLDRNDYTEDDLNKAVGVLAGSATSALENRLASDNIALIEHKLAGMKLLKRIKKR